VPVEVMKVTKYTHTDVEQLLESAIADVKDSVTGDLSVIETQAHNVCCELGLVNEVEKELNYLFQWKTIKQQKEFRKGFPGVVLVAVVGRLLNNSYNPSTGFYKINPRPLFEKHIRPVLHGKYKAPMGLSDPLNVAKNANVLDDEWARGKRPEWAAMATVNLVKWAATASENELKALLRILVWVYLTLSKLYTRQLPQLSLGIDLNAARNLLISLINMAPAGGATAQNVVGALLQAQHDLFKKEGILEGVGESVYATNTTSGKPGDFSEAFDNQLHIYEVTTKKVDLQRVDESAEAILHYLAQTLNVPQSLEITFLCRHKDIEIEGLEINTSLTHKGVRYHFVDLHYWIFMMLERLGPTGRNTALSLIENYIRSASTDLTVKGTWEDLVSGDLAQALIEPQPEEIANTTFLVDTQPEGDIDLEPPFIQGDLFNQ